MAVETQDTRMEADIKDLVLNAPRVTKEHIEADTKAESNVGYATSEAQAISEAAPVTTFVAPVDINPFAAVAAKNERL